MWTGPKETHDVRIRQLRWRCRGGKGFSLFWSKSQRDTSLSVQTDVPEQMMMSWDIILSWEETIKPSCPLNICIPVNCPSNKQEEKTLPTPTHPPAVQRHNSSVPSLLAAQPLSFYLKLVTWMQWISVQRFERWGGTVEVPASTVDSRERTPISLDPSPKIII